MLLQGLSFCFVALAFAIAINPDLEFTNSIDMGQCKQNQRYSDCVTACPLSCGKKNLPKEDCPYPCSPGCECKDGYYLNSTLDCVKPEDCVPKTYDRILPVNCGENQQFSFCRSPCPLTCGKKPINPCPHNCTFGCECLDGYYLTKNKECVKQTDCPRRPKPLFY
ncbi:GSCOCG00009616001-RA-CDS [Cotesia congregata]|nr:GSCOCG00009616001-RA-CDS [Cotesia congregata]